MKLKSKTVVPYKGEVIDLCVENSHTYNVEGVAVHNSGGGSLVAYMLYITDLDPLKWDLPFSRFLSIYRKGAPDIDTDLADRDKVLEQLRNFFGFENVVPISNYNTFKLKTLVKDIGKFYGISFEETNAATRTVEDEVRKATMKHGDDKNLFVLTYEEALKYSKSFKDFIDKYPLVAESIQVLFKQNRSLGRHAGGVLIADDLPNKMPLVCSGGEPQSPWVEGVNFKHLEYIGNFIKYDLLGLETLRLIERSIELILIKNGKKNPTFDDVKLWYEQNMAPDVIDFNDQRVFEYVYHGARWAGIFQCVDSETRVTMSTGTQTVIRDVKVGDEVLTFDEKTKTLTSSCVDEIYDQGIKECIELTFDNGNTLICTIDHPILTKRGWICAGELNDDDDIDCFN
jgi:DNA polymerase III alpha subunit